MKIFTTLETKKIGKYGNFHFILQFWKSKLIEYCEIVLNSWNHKIGNFFNFFNFLLECKKTFRKFHQTKKTTKFSISDFFCFLKRILKNMTRNWKNSPNYQNHKTWNNWKVLFFATNSKRMEIFLEIFTKISKLHNYKKLEKFLFFTTNYKILKNIWKISPNFQNQQFVKIRKYHFWKLKTQKSMTPKN